MSNFSKYWTARGNSKKAEVFTPSFLVREILDKIPSWIWESSETLFLDLCFGSGTFIQCIVEKLREYGHSDENISKRIWGIDISRKWYNRVKHFKVGEYNIENIYCADSLNTNILDNMKFDVVCGNPPFQGPYEGSNSYWKKFIKLSIDLLKDGGYMAYISPQSWMYDEKVNPIIKRNNLIFADISIDRFFPGLGSTFSYFILSKERPNGKSHIKSIESDFYLDFSKSKPIPSKNINEKSISIFEKFYSKKDKFEMVIMSRGYRDYSNEKTDEYKYPAYNTKANPEVFIKRPQFREVKKVIFTHPSVFEPFYDDGNMNVARQVVFIEVGSDDEGKNLLSYLNSKLFCFIQNNSRDGGWFGMKYIPKIDISRGWTDEEVYEFFSLSDEEIKYIKSQKL